MTPFSHCEESQTKLGITKQSGTPPRLPRLRLAMTIEKGAMTVEGKQ